MQKFEVIYIYIAVSTLSISAFVSGLQSLIERGIAVTQLRNSGNH